jgi:hypothetical protein
MSSNAPQHDEWKPERVHNVIRRFKKGPDKKPHFIGQEPDEVVRRIVREHYIFYWRTAIPLFLAIIVFGLLVWANTAQPQLSSIWHALEIFSAISIVIAALYSAYRIFELWWVNVDVITNKRILTWRGLLSPTKDETTLDKVQQVAVDQDSIFEVIFEFGTVHVYLAGGKALVLKHVPKPKEIRDDIEGIRESYQAGKKKKDAPPPVVDPQLKDVLATLAKNEELPKLPDADKRYEYRRKPGRLRGPLRTFGGPLRIPCDVHYDSEEYTVMYIQRSKIVLFYYLIVPILICIGLLIGALVARYLFGLFAIGFLAMAIVIGLEIINYVDDVFILTNKRIIDIERKLIFLFEQHDTSTYDKISKIEVKSPNVFELALDVGNLYIETQGNNPNIHMRRIPHPFFIQDKIYTIKGFKEKVDKVKASNDRKNDLNLWFSTVLSALETKVVNRGVPNLQALDLWAAVERASQFGMKVIPVGESSMFPAIPAGKIVSQIPPPGTLVQTDPDNPEEKPQIQVILSKRTF